MISQKTPTTTTDVFLHISAVTAIFFVPNGIYAINHKAFNDVTSTLRRVFIPKSVQVNARDTFSKYRNPDYSYSATENKPPLVIECEADSRPDGFYYKLHESKFEEDYEFYYETYLHTWLGSRYIGTGKWSDDSSDSYPEFLFPAVRWVCKSLDI